MKYPINYQKLEHFFGRNIILSYKLMIKNEILLKDLARPKVN